MSDFWKTLAISNTRGLLWTWHFELDTVGQGKVIPERSINGLKIRWSLPSAAWPQVLQQLHDLRLHLHKLRMRPHAHKVLLHMETTEPSDGEGFRLFIAQFAEWVGVDCGIYIQHQIFGKEIVTIDNMHAWWHGREIHLLEKGILDYAAQADTMRLLRMWIAEFQTAPISVPGWVCALGEAESAFVASLPRIRIWKNRVFRVARYCSILICIVLCALGWWGFKQHAHHLKQLGQYTFTHNADVWDEWLSLLEINYFINDSLMKCTRTIPPGFGFSRYKERSLQEHEKRWGIWQKNFLRVQEDGVRNCVQGLDYHKNCELLVASKRIAWEWISGKPQAAKKLHDAWYVLLGNEEIPWIPAYDSWLQSTTWKQNSVLSNDVFWSDVVTASQTMEQMFVQFRNDHQSIETLNLRAWGAEQDRTLHIAQIALPSVQESVEDLFALHARDTLYQVFLTRLRCEQLRVWAEALSALRLADQDESRAILECVGHRLGIDSAAVNAAWRKLQIPMLRDSTIALWNQDWMRVWPLQCDPRYTDADPQELMRILGVNGDFDQWRNHLGMDSSFLSQDSSLKNWLNPLFAWSKTMLKDSSTWRTRETHFAFCGVPHWDLVVKVDSLAWSIPSGVDSCISGTISWPAQGSSLELIASHGTDRMQWKRRGLFSISRFVNEFGSWKNGQGLRVQIPLRTKSFTSQWVMQWQETGPDPRLIKPCGMAIQRSDNGDKLSK